MGQGYVGPDADIGEAVQQTEDNEKIAEEEKRKQNMDAVPGQNSVGNEEMMVRCGLRNKPTQPTDPSTPGSEPKGPDPNDPVKTPAGPHLELSADGTPSEQEKNLRTSNDPKDKRLIATLDRARAAYGDMVKDGARIIVTTSEGNGGEPVLMVLPKGYDPNQQTEVHTHYHGVDQTVAEGDDHGAGLKTRIRDTQKANPQAVFVLPESKDGHGNSWSNVKSITQTTDDALRHCGVSERKINDPCDPNAAYRIVSAHSGGGEAIRTAIEGDPKAPKDPTGSRLRANELHLRDCLYGNTEQAVADWAKTSNGQNVNQVVYMHATNNSNGSKLREAFSQEGDDPNKYRQVNMPGMVQAGDPKRKPDKQNPHDRSNHVLWKSTDDGRGVCVDNSAGPKNFHDTDFKYVEPPPRKSAPNNGARTGGR